MPETTYRISELTAIDNINNGDLVEVSTVDPNSESGYASRKASMTDLGNKLNNGMEYSTELVTNDKRIIGAINEIAQGGGGSADIISTASGTIATFNDGGDNIPVKSLVTGITATQAGTGTPSPDNVRAVIGVDTVDVVVTGKNLMPSLFGSNTNNGITYTVNEDGTIIVSGAVTSGNSNRNYGHMVLQAGTYTLSGLPDTLISTTAREAALVLAKDVYSGSQNIIISLYSNIARTATFTLEETTDCYLRIYLYTTAGTMPANTIFKPMIEIGETASEFESFRGTRHIITLPETIYGGNANLTDGTGTKDFGYIEFDGSEDEDWSYSTGNKWATITIPDMMSGANQEGMVNWLPKSTSYGYFGFALGRNNNNFYAYQIPDISGVTDLASWKTYLSTHPLQVKYPLAQSGAISFSQVKIPTLSGLNNIYTDCGDIQSLEYFNENGNDIDSLVNLETRLSGRIRTKTYTGDGSVPLVVTFDEVPTMILNFFGPGQNSQVITFPFIYGLTSFGGVYVSPNPWTSPTQAGGGHLLYKVAYSNGGKTMTVRASASDAGAHFNQSGDTYTIYYLV